MFLNLTLASRHTSPIIASGILNLTLAYLPCSRTLHVKCRLLLEDLITSPNIGAWHGQRRRISLPVRGAGYELLIPFRGYSAKLKRERNQRSLACWSWESSAEFSRRRYLNPPFFPTRTQTTRQYIPKHQYILHTMYKGGGNPASCGGSPEDVAGP